MYINFEQNWENICRLVKTVRTNISANNCKLHKFASTPIVFFKYIILDMHSHKTYINFQQNRVCRSVKTVHTILFAKKLQVA